MLEGRRMAQEQQTPTPPAWGRGGGAGAALLLTPLPLLFHPLPSCHHTPFTYARICVLSLAQPSGWFQGAVGQLGKSSMEECCALSRPTVSLSAVSR